MSVILDYISAAIIFGILALTVTRVNMNINASLFQNTYRVNIQQAGVQLAHQIEYDFLKIGHHIKGTKISNADTTSIKFYTDLTNTNDTTAWVSYSIGDTTQTTFTTNPRDFPLFREHKGVSVTQQYGLISFSIAYYDTFNVEMKTPINTTVRLDSIKSIRVKFTVESPEPVISFTDTTYSAINWEKWMFPRNLGKKDY